jgi:hypothetical protein
MKTWIKLLTAIAALALVASTAAAVAAIRRAASGL